MTLSRRQLFTLAALRLGRSVRVGIWGTTGHTAEVLDALPQLPDVQVVALAESDPDRARTFAANPKLPGLKTYPDARAMLDSEKLDVVAIANDNGGRAAAILECASRRLHVFAEKPLALTEPDLASIRAAVRKHGVRLGCMVKMRTDPWFLAMHRLVREGAIGEVAQIEAQKSYKSNDWPEWKTKYSTYGGTIPWIGIDLIDLCRFTSGREFRSVASMQAHIGFPELGQMENSTGSLLRMDNGGVAVVRLDYFRTTEAPTHGDDRLRLAGTKGVVEYQMSNGVTLQQRGHPPRTLTDLPPRRWLFADFLAAIYAGGQDDIKEDDLYRSTLATLRAWKAAKTSQIVEI